MSTEQELNGRQRLELALLCEDVEVPGSDFTATFTALVAYVASEGITPEHLAAPRDRVAFTYAYTAALTVRHPDDFEPGSLGYRALVAAGCKPPDPTVPTDDGNDELEE
ncbi:MAG: hypothetical protein K8U57_37825 [Planctomycetes bacterium]|nr:hypothetical protein [Planctomycetota bacterium]